MNNEFRVNGLCKSLDQFDRIIIYGTGDYAQKIYPFLKKKGLKQKIFCFTQTQNGERESIDSIPVVKIDLVDKSKNNCVVLIAVSEKYSNEVKQTVVSFGYTNIISLVDYRIHTEDEFCSLTTFEEYCDYIADWYIENRMDGQDKEAVLQRLLKRGKEAGKETNSKLIVIICGHMTVRNNKIVGALKRKGYTVVMLNYHMLNDITCCCLNELEQLNIQRISCYCIEEMLYEALQYDPLVYFFEPRWAECLWAKIMLKNKKSFGKVVLALYDVLNDSLLEQSQRRMDSERYALENADGILWRWFSKDYLEEKGFTFQGKSLQFLDYCSHECPELDSLELEITPSVIKLCEVSGVADDYIEERTQNPRYLDFAKVGEILEKIGNRPDCIFHFFGSHLKKENIEKCIQYEKKYKNFKFFIGVEHDELLRRLSYYDYGCDFYTNAEWPPDDMPVGGRAVGRIRKNCVRNILFDYLSAGLPIITTTPLKLLEYLQPYDVVVRMNTANIDIDFLKQNRNYYREKVREAREELDIDVQIPRLIDFFNDL